MNPNLRLTFTVKLACDNKTWRKNASENAEGDAAFLTESLKGALQDAVNEVLERELGEGSSGLVYFTCEVVDDDKSPIYSYEWCDGAPKWCNPEPELDSGYREFLRTSKAIQGIKWTHCYPMRNGEELPYCLVCSFDAETGEPLDPIGYIIYDDKHTVVDSGEGDEQDCQRRFEEIMKEETAGRILSTSPSKISK